MAEVGAAAVAAAAVGPGAAAAAFPAVAALLGLWRVARLLSRMSPSSWAEALPAVSQPSPLPVALSGVLAVVPAALTSRAEVLAASGAAAEEGVDNWATDGCFTLPPQPCGTERWRRAGGGGLALPPLCCMLAAERRRPAVAAAEPAEALRLASRARAARSCASDASVGSPRCSWSAT